MVRSFLVIIVLCLHLSTSAQILNAEQLYQTLDSADRIKGNVGLALSTIKQKSTINRIANRANATIKLKNSDMMVAGGLNVLISKNERLISNGFLHLRYRNQPIHIYTPELFTQYQWDFIRGLENRYLLGGYLRFKAYSDSSGALTMGVGTMYENEYWNYRGSISNEMAAIDTLIITNVIKFNSYASGYYHFNEHISSGIIIYFQAKYRDMLRPRIAGVANLDFKILKNLNYSISYDWFYDMAPVAPIPKLYYILDNRVVYSF